jgi:integrase
LEKARAEAGRIAKQLASNNAEAASMTSREAGSYGKAVEYLRPTGMSLELAAETVAKAIEILGSNRILEACNFFKDHGADSITPRKVQEVVTEMIAQMEKDKLSERYVETIRPRCKRFSESFQVDIGSISGADVQHWLDALDCSPRTRKNYRDDLNSLFAYAEARRYIAKNANPVSTAKTRKPRGGKIEIYTLDEIAGLLKHAPADFLPFVAIGAFAGLRTSEIERLKFEDFFNGDYIEVAADKTKTASRRLVPVLPNLRKWLEPYARKKGRLWTGTEKEFLAARAKTVADSGIAWKDNGLRHSWISYRMADIQDAPKVAIEAGNSPEMIFRNYRELVKPEAAKTWFAITPETPENVVSMGKGAHA